MTRDFSDVTTGYNSGGYPLMYVGDVFAMCGDCASKMSKGEQDKLVTQVHMEGPSISCEECGKEVESAYGDPDEE